MRRPPRTDRRAVILLVATWFVAGCGYFMAGEWTDDDGNWSRVFGSAKPADVEVVHSRYWRSPHWSYEAGYVFEIRANPRPRAELFQRNRLVQLLGRDAEPAKSDCVPACPTWFAPRPPDVYSVWRYVDEPSNNFRLLIDNATGTIFMTDYGL